MSHLMLIERLQRVAHERIVTLMGQLVEPLPDTRDAAEGAACRVARGLAAHAVGGETIGLQLEVRPDLVREVVVSAAAPERHPRSGSGPSTRAIAAASRRHFVVSRSSCARPVFVSV